MPHRHGPGPRRPYGRAVQVMDSSGDNWQASLSEIVQRTGPTCLHGVGPHAILVGRPMNP